MILTVEGLAFGYRTKLVGSDVSLAVAEGEVLCLLGPNGGGKTTLFKTLLGLLPPQAGRVTVQGKDIAALSRTEIARLIAYVPQAHIGYFPFTVFDVVLMGRTAHIGSFAAPSAHDHAVVASALSQLGIDHLADAVYTRISGGERQLALIARALSQESRILVMDEPTASLDFGNQVRVLDRIVALSRRGIAVILSTHDPDQAFLCADRVALLGGGRLAGLGRPTDMITPENLKRLYGVDVAVLEVAMPDTERRTRVCIPSLALNRMAL